MTQKLNFLFTSWEGGGNITPALAVVRKLMARGHRVRFMSDSCNQSEAEAFGAIFIAWSRAPNRVDRTPETQTYRDWAAPTPQEGLLSVIRDAWCGPALAYALDVMEELRGEPADLVVTNEALFGVMAGCERFGQPFATLCPNISLLPLPGIPPLGPGLAPARNDEERDLHYQIAQASEAMFDSGLPLLNAARAEIGLMPLAHLFDQLVPAKIELLATSAAFDFPAHRLPKKVRYVGPQIDDPNWASPWQCPWPKSDTRPLVCVSFSTTFQNHASILQNVLNALAPLPVRVLVTLGGSVKITELHSPENCILLDSVQHSAVMREASMVVTHGGHGTVMRALLSRLPMLLIPQGRDQNDNAVRVTERGAGISLRHDASIDTIRKSCLKLLHNASYAAAAKWLGDLVAAEAENSSVVFDLESVASDIYCRDGGTADQMLTPQDVI